MLARASVRIAEVPSYGALIDGCWTGGKGQPFLTHNPAHPNQTVGAYTAVDSTQVAEAVASARQAQAEWRRIPALERGQRVTAWLDALESRADTIARIIVLEQGKPLADGLVARARALRLGDGMLAGVTTGPLIHSEHRNTVHARVERALQLGAECLTGGNFAKPGSASLGWFYEPTVLLCPEPGLEITAEEVFGPVITIQPYADFDEALALVNGVKSGLTAALFTDSHRLVHRFLDECDTGMLHVNHGSIPGEHMPFGGIKHSGVGVSSSVGPSAIRFYTTEHAAYLQP